MKSVSITTVTIYYSRACFQISVQKTGLVRHLILRVPFTAFFHRSATVPAVVGIPGRRFHNPELHRGVMILSVYRNSTVFSHYTVDTLQLTVIHLRVENQLETLGVLTMYTKILHCYCLFVGVYITKIEISLRDLEKKNLFGC